MMYFGSANYECTDALKNSSHCICLLSGPCLGLLHNEEQYPNQRLIFQTRKYSMECMC